MTDALKYPALAIERLELSNFALLMVILLLLILIAELLALLPRTVKSFRRYK